MGKDKDFAEYYTTVGTKLKQLPEVLNAAKEDYRRNTNIKPSKVIPSLKNNFRMFKSGGILKGQQGVIAPNPITDMAMDKGKNINWLGLPLPKKNYGLSDLDIKSLEAVKYKIPKYSQAFLKAGYTKEQTAGILGNLFQESKLNPDTMQYRGGKGYGLGQ